MQLYIASQKQLMGDSRAGGSDGDDWYAVVTEVCSQKDEYGAFIISKDLGDRLREMANEADGTVVLKKLQNVEKAYKKKR